MSVNLGGQQLESQGLVLHLAFQALEGCIDDLFMIEGHAGKVIDIEPGRVARIRGPLIRWSLSLTKA